MGTTARTELMQNVFCIGHFVSRKINVKDKTMKKMIKAFVADETGMQTGEYMVLGTVMAAGSIGAVGTVRDGIVDQFAGLTDGLNVDTDGNVGGGNGGGGNGG